MNHSPERVVTPTAIPIPGARIDAGADPADATGHFTISGFPMQFPDNAPFLGGTFVRAPGYFDENVSFSISADGTTNVVVPLVKSCNSGRADIRVLDQTTRKPLAGVEVTMDTASVPCTS